MAYAVYITAAAQRDVRRLPQQIQARIRPAIRALAETPRPHGVRKLEGAGDLYRIGVSDYRIIYSFADDPPRVTVTRVRHRRDVCRAD